MNQWQFLDLHFAKCCELPIEKQAIYIEELLVPDHLNPSEVKNELRELIKSFYQSEDTDFLEPGTTIKSVVGPLKTSAIEKYSEIADHIVLDILGEGSFGKVYLAENKKLGRKVALKISPDHGGEARTLASLEHENIVKVFEEVLLKEQELRVVSLQHISGPTLKKVYQSFQTSPEIPLEKILEKNSVKYRPFTSWEVEQWEKIKKNDNGTNLLIMILKLARALEHAHDLDIYHMDIKPGNVLISPAGTPYLADFNISTNKDRDMDFLIGGTKKYMSPEHLAVLTSETPEADYKKLDGRCDIFSLGKMLEEGMQYLGDLDEDLTCILKRATQESAEKRFSSVQDFANTLETHLTVRLKKKALRCHSLLCSLVKSPVLALMIIGAFPHLIGSVISISYNWMRIVSLLNDQQKEIFNSTVLIYNAIVLPAGIIFFGIKLWPLVSTFKRMRSGYCTFWSDKAESAREALLKAPGLLFVAGSLGWLSAGAVFPGAINFFYGSIPAEATAHFAISFILSWAISVTYSILFYQYFALEHVLPRLMGGVFGKHSLSIEESEKISANINFYHTIAAIIPMLMALLILTLDPVNFSGGKFVMFRGLSATLIVVGMAAFLLASKLKERSARTLAILSESSHSQQ